MGSDGISRRGFIGALGGLLGAGVASAVGLSWPRRVDAPTVAIYPANMEAEARSLLGWDSKANRDPLHWWSRELAKQMMEAKDREIATLFRNARFS